MLEDSLSEPGGGKVIALSLLSLVLLGTDKHLVFPTQAAFGIHSRFLFTALRELGIFLAWCAVGAHSIRYLSRANPAAVPDP